jgi:hypothetical protein
MIQSLPHRGRKAPYWTLIVCVLLSPTLNARAAELTFNRDIRPILSENCFYCHGQDPKHREAKLRLDLPETAYRDLGGYAAVVPGKPDKSEVIARLMSGDDEKRMPPPKSGKHVSPAQIQTLRRWIASGAVYEKHWAFQTPRRPALPVIKQNAWPKNAIDYFVLARLEAEGLPPSKEAAPEKWLRRASFDLIGLPPSPSEIDQFLADVRARGEAAYEAAADRLLASERFGERRAIEWLDVARYADTHGFNNDSTRSMWRWRDWVIEAFNANKPYDQFIIEQLAGDLLPNPTLDQRLATGFCRNHVINSEGGIIDEEYRVEYVADRVRTTSTAFLGLTMECSRCHDHKFDPILQKDYYRLFAFFNNVAEYGEDGRVANAVPMIPAPTQEQSRQLAGQTKALAELDSKLAALRKEIPADLESSEAVVATAMPKAMYSAHKSADLESSEAVFATALNAANKATTTKPSFELDCDSSKPKAKAWRFPTTAPSLAPGVRGKAWVSRGDGPLAKLDAVALSLNGPAGATISFWLNSSEDAPRDVAIFSSLNHQGNPADAGFGKGVEIRLIDHEIEFRASDRFPVYAMRVRSQGAELEPNQWRQVTLTFTPPDPQVMRVPASAIRIFVDGYELPTRWINDGLSTFPGNQPWLVATDNSTQAPVWKGMLDDVKRFPRALTSTQIAALFQADALPLAISAVQNHCASARERLWLSDCQLAALSDAKELIEQRARGWEEHLALQRALPTSMVMAEMPTPRKTFVLTRGQYNLPGEAVEAGVPETLLVPWPEGAPRNRLGLARWFVRPDHPLTARVVVNRWWAQLFGMGIVKTVEDFGSQSEWPSHPELLDWLAREFVDSGWNTKALFRKVVLSATYRQDSSAAPELIERDPENRLLARGPRVRLPAELIRDQALEIAGLIKQRLGGPSVFPYQPEGLYKGVVVDAKYPGTTWPLSSGDDLYRRSLYTFWKRTAPHPEMLTFDMPDREFCTARRSRTNTPLQALTLMNETGMVEAARQLGTRMIHQGGKSDAARIALGFRLATGRLPTDAETGVLIGMWDKFRADFTADPQAASDLLKVGASKADETVPAPELASATMVGSLLLNLDETITKD